MTPRLRRYARGLVSGHAAACEVSDSLVHATLMRAIGARGLGGVADLPVRLFATVTQLHRDLAPAERSEFAAGGSRRPSFMAPGGSQRAPTSRLAGGLMALSVEEREALLLVTLEGFDHATVARILRVSRPVLLERLTRARTALACHLGEPLSSPVPTRVPYLRLVVG